MLTFLTDGHVRTLHPGNNVAGLRIRKVELTAADVQHPQFLSWFSIVLTCFSPAAIADDDCPDKT